MGTFRLSSVFFVLVISLLLLPCGASSHGKEGVLLVAFGTSVPEAKKAFQTIEREYRAAFPGVPIVWAYTSQIIRKKLAAQGVDVGSIGQGLDKLASLGVRTVRIQSLHMLAGEEFAALARSALVQAKKYAKQFDAVYLGRPLLESNEDAAAVGRAILLHMRPLRQKGDALVLMAHGQEHGRGDLALEGTRAILGRQDSSVFLATVEGSRGFEQMADDMKSKGLKKVWLMPFMVVAGDHARNDLAGDEADSWASRLRKDGYEVEANLRGLGELPEIGKIFIRHTKSSKDDLMLEPRKP